ncbi:MAG: hypothetical protein MHPSP_004052, partial [Paramarteilia canceri]
MTLEEAPQNFSKVPDGSNDQNDEYINITMSQVTSDFGNDLSLFKKPCFLCIEPKPFHPSNYEELKTKGIDEESLANFYVSLHSSIRCRYKRNEANSLVYNDFGELELESNARIVEWDDGSVSLHVGEEIYDIHTMDNKMNFNQLFVHQGSGMHSQSIFKNKIIF